MYCVYYVIYHNFSIFQVIVMAQTLVTLAARYIYL